ncbi:CheY-like superfamily [Mycena olivaceomarginata]|nr:CheY-like superfamily [Mycena olivaceomarginata]
MHDDTGIEECLSELGLVPVVVDISEVSDKEKCPHIDTIIVDSLSITECLREHEHLRYIPVALLEPVLPPLNENSISAYNTTPITAFDLYHVLLPSALGTNTVNPASAAAEVTYDILLAEDNLVYQRLVLKMLEKYGHSIELAENGSLALQAFMERVLHQKPFHVIIMDVWMPLMGGIEATQRIREYEAQYHLASTPIIALMAHGLSGDRERCLQAGMDDIIPRPMRRDDLRLHTRIIPKPHSLYHLVSPTVPDTADLLYPLSPLSLSIKISWEGILVCLAPRHFAQLHEDPNSGEEVTITVLGSAQGFNYIMPRFIAT